MDLGTIIGFLIVGLIAGVVARFLVPGPDPMGLLFGGVVALSPTGIVGSIIGAIIVLLIWRQVGGRRATA